MTDMNSMSNSMSNSSTTNTINDSDVLCGRGGATNNHVGNKMFRSMVSEHQREYLSAKKKDKALISQRIVRLVREQGGRFLRRTNDGLWTDVGNKKATEKTSQALREGLDVRSFAAAGNGKSQRRNSDSSSTSSAQETPPQKRRRTTAAAAAVATSTSTADKRLSNQSPAGISLSPELHSMPDLAEEIPRMMPDFVFHDVQSLAATDIENVVEI